jgi:tetraacyldisaccharide 4'-kinase
LIKILFTPSAFHDLVSGRRRGPAAAALRAALRLAEWPYTWAVNWRNRRYDSGASAIHRAGVPVVSVGNLTLGGTGKTPMVEWLARWFHQQGVRVALISRGYGSKAGADNDEARQLQRQLPEVPRLQNADRAAAAEEAVKRLRCQAIVLDDAFQHRRLARDLDIVMLDASAPFGFGHVFPRGLLREPIGSLKRAHVVILSRADMIEPEERMEIRRQARQIAPNALWAEVVHAPQALVSAGARQPLESLRGQPVAAFCGIGNPAGFRQTLRTCGFNVVDFREFPDHYAYRPSAVESLVQWADRLDVAAVVCTQKDAVKLEHLGGDGNTAQPDGNGPILLGKRPLWAVQIALEFLGGRDDLQQRLLALLAR